MRVSERSIERVFGWEALDSRGTPTVGCEVTLADGATGTVVVPSGASTGAYEAHELRDGGERYGGRGVLRAVASVNGELREALAGRDASDQAALDAELRRRDGTADLSRLGANAVLAVSIAACRASAASAGESLHRHVDERRDEPGLLPLPMINVISGGAHAAGALDIQDLLVMPVGATTTAEAIEWCWRVRAGTAAVASEQGLPVALVADEGGLGLPLASNRAAVDLLGRGIERSGLEPGAEVAIAIDVAATQLHRGDHYELKVDGRRLDAGQLVDELLAWAASHPIVSYEDPLGDEDWDGWAGAGARLHALQVIGDDLFATNLERLERGIAEGAANAILVKPNQIGTLSDARAALERAQAAGFATVLSGRSGDTEDTWLSDLAVGWRAGQVKIGSTMRSERTAKWNRLLQLEAARPSAELAPWRVARPRSSTVSACATSRPAVTRPPSASATRCSPASRATAGCTCRSAGRSSPRSRRTSPTRASPRASWEPSRATTSSRPCSSGCARTPTPISAIRRSAHSCSSTPTSGCSSSSTARRSPSRTWRCSSSGGCSSTS